MSKKPQYLTPNGFVRSAVNPLKDMSKELKAFRKKKSAKLKVISPSRLTPLAPLKISKKMDIQNSTQRRTISKEAAKAIAAAISGMISEK